MGGVLAAQSRAWCLSTTLFLFESHFCPILAISSQYPHRTTVGGLDFVGLMGALDGDVAASVNSALDSTI